MNDFHDAVAGIVLGVSKPHRRIGGLCLRNVKGDDNN